MLNSYYNISELDAVLQSGYYQSPLGYDNIDWVVNDVKKLENKMNFYFENTKKDVIMTEEIEEDYRNENICRLCEKKIQSDKVTDHCQLTGKYRGPVHDNCKINVTQDQSNSIQWYFRNLVVRIVICFLKSYLIKRRIK